MHNFLQNYYSCDSHFGIVNHQQTKSEASVSDQTVSSFVKEGGKNYNLATDNCQHAAKRMADLGNK